MSRSSSRKRVSRLLAALATPVLVVSTLTALASAPPAHAASPTVPEPDGWYAGDMHVHRSCGDTAELLSSIKAKMDDEDLRFISLLADCGNGEVQDPTTDLPLVTGQDASISTAGRTVHWDSEWHWDATYGQYLHQALGGHLVNLGETSASQVWDEMPSAIIDGVHQQGGISGFAHLQYLPSGIPDSLNCCTPVEYPVEVALGSADFISEDVTNTGDTAIEAYYRLLNTGFRPGFAAGTDYPCGNSVIGSRLTYSNLGGESVTYRNWIDAIKSGRTVISRNGHNEFLDLTVNGTAGPGDEVDLAGAGSVPVTVTWTATADYTGLLQLVQNGQVIATRSATVSAGSPVTLTADVDFAKSGWVAARRMNADGNDHQVHTAAAFVVVNGAPIRVSADDAQFYIDWMDTLLARTSPGGEWNKYFPTELAAAQARYQEAKLVFQQRKAESVDTTAPTVVSHVPASSATGVGVGSAVTVTFSEPVAQASVTGSSVSLKAGSTGVPATLSVSGSTVTVTPSASLAPSSVYTASVSTGVTDLAGNHLASPVSWSFTTGVGTFSAPTPTISDTSPVVGEVLSADAGTWVPVPDVTAYQWLRGPTEISGATSSSYTVQAADRESTLSVRVTGSKAGYTTLSKTSVATTAVAEGTLTSAKPTITGALGVGQTLTADEGAWGPEPVAFSYQWVRGSIEVGTARTYTVTPGDVDSTLTVTVTGSKTGYTSVARTSDPTGTIAANTFVPATPTIAGTAAVGGLLTADEGTWVPAPDSFAYQWLRDDKVIGGATGRTYTVTTADAGSSLTVEVTGSKANYTTASVMSTKRTIEGAFLTATPTILGDAVVGGLLTAAPGTWLPTPDSFAYQWVRGSSDVAGATGNTYAVTAADVGSTLSVRVTGSKANYTSASKTSVATATVPVPVLPPASPNPTITGVARVGMPLVANLGSWNPAPTKVTYQWYWLKSSGKRVAISKATKAGYTPSGSVQGRRLQVRIKASLSTTIATRYSSPTAKVAAPMTGRTPKISDTTPKVGQLLTAKPGTWKPTRTTFTYQWYAKRGSGKVIAIPGATGAAYQVEARYAGYTLKVTVTGSASGYRSVAKSSSYSHKVAR